MVFRGKTETKHTHFYEHTLMRTQNAGKSIQNLLLDTVDVRMPAELYTLYKI